MRDGRDVFIEQTNVGTDVLCSLPNPAWFELVSETPADGTCALRLRARGLNRGKRFEQSFAVTLANTRELAVVP
ncbi:MAG TPA: hypothetical protein VFX59_11565 [Polyangiales bacterium]|nr:hypothetical protein [Polyangiales bacterium]